MVLISIDAKATGKNIKRLREKHGLSVAQLAEQLGFSAPQAVYHWQKGQCVPSLDNLLILSHLFQVTMDDIIITRQPHTAATPKLHIVSEQQADACCSVISDVFSSQCSTAA